MRLNGKPFTVVGVAPRGFTGVNLDSLPDVWVPMAMANEALPELADNHILTGRNLSFLDIVGRLKPGVPIARAQAELDGIAKRRAAAEPADRQDPMARVLPAPSFAVGPDARPQARRISWLLFGCASLVLLIACADAAGLLLVRAERRRREMGVRLALGATRSRIARQLLVESLVLAGLAGALGVLFAVWGSDLLARADAGGSARSAGRLFPVLDWRVLVFAAAAACASALIFGMAPAWRAAATELVPALKGEASWTGRRRSTLKDALVGAQVALTAVLLVAAGLMTRTLARQAAVEPGFSPSGKLEASIDLARQGYTEKTGAVFYAAAPREHPGDPRRPLRRPRADDPGPELRNARQRHGRRLPPSRRSTSQRRPGRGHARILPDPRRPARPRPRLRRPGPGRFERRRHRQRGDGPQVLARAESHRPPDQGHRAGGHRGRGDRRRSPTCACGASGSRHSPCCSCRSTSSTCPA